MEAIDLCDNKYEEAVVAEPEGRSAVSANVLGIGFTALIACLGYGMVKLPGFDHVGPLACAIILAVIYRQVWGYPEALRSGIQISAKKLLRLAIVLFGLKLNVDVIFHQGATLLLYDLGTIVFAITATMLLANVLHADMGLSLLLGIGTGVCGAAAIAAVSPILKSKDDDTAMGVGIVALVGTVFSLAYTILRPFLDITNVQYGIWSGISLHEIAHVALAAAPAGQDALAMALLAKLGRVFLLIPLSLILMYWMNRRGKEEAGTKVDVPWFLLGFLGMSLLGSYVLADTLQSSTALNKLIADGTSFLLTMAMVGLGLNVNLRELRDKALRPLAAMLITSVVLSVLALKLV